MIDGLSVGESKFVSVMGILASFAFLLALYAGQLVFTNRLIGLGTGREVQHQRLGAKMVAVFRKANYALAELWVTILAIVVNNGVGDSMTSTPFFAPPNVERIPVYLLLTELLMLIWPLLAIGISVSRNTGLVRKYAAASFFAFLFVHVHFIIGQLGFLAGRSGSAAPAVGASQHNSVVFMACFLGPYFKLKDAEEAKAKCS